jgi:hypothetical protein
MLLYTNYESRYFVIYKLLTLYIYVGRNTFIIVSTKIINNKLSILSESVLDGHSYKYSVN